MSLPSILKVGVLPSVQNMNIDTSVLDPINISDSECVFQIPRNGILDGGSMISLAVRTATGVSDAFFPVKTGAYSLIKSAHLLIGGKEIASCEDCAEYETMVSQFTTPEHRAFVESVKSFRSMDRYVEVDEATGRLLPQDLDYGTFANDASARATVPANLKPTDNDSTTPVASVPLSSLIPFMRSRQLPLFTIKENVFIRLVFNTQSSTTDGTICCFPSGSGSSGVVVPSRVNIKFYADHLYYEDNTMQEVQSQVFSEKGLSYLYEDSILTVAQIPASANPNLGSVAEQSVERDVAVAGRVVRSMMVAEKFTTLGDNAGAGVLGKYMSNDLQTDTTYNWRINEQRLYDRDVSAPSHKYTELGKVLGMPLQVPSQLYSFDVDSDKDSTDKALNQNSVYIGQIESYQLPTATNTAATQDIRATSHYLGVDLTTSGLNVLGNGTRVSSKPIILTKNYKRTNGKNQAREIRVYANVERMITIRGGSVVVSA